MLPLPNTNNLWVNFRSPLMWDVFAISTYLTVSLLFWYMGLVPDLASMRDRVKGFKRLVFGFMSFGWTGSLRQWHHYECGYAFLAALATPLVLSVHSIVSWDLLCLCNQDGILLFSSLFVGSYSFWLCDGI